MPMMSAMNPDGLVESDRCRGAGNARVRIIGGMGMNGMNGVFMNPMAAPYLSGISDVEQPDRRDDADESDGMLTGIGSGQLSGVRPGAGQSKGRTKQPAREVAGHDSDAGRTGGAVF